MHVITRTRLVEFWEQHEDSKTELRAWFRMMRSKRYAKTGEVRKDFPSADSVGSRKMVFNIRGNRYRLIVDMRYDLGRVYVRHVVTQKEYERLMKGGLL